jgi:hypothetical protein
MKGRAAGLRTFWMRKLLKADTGTPVAVATLQGGEPGACGVS